MKTSNRNRVRLALLTLVGIAATTFNVMAQDQSDQLKAALDVIRKAKDKKGDSLDPRAKKILEGGNLEERARQAFEKLDQNPDPEELARYKEAANRLQKAKGNMTEEGLRRLSSADRPATTVAAPSEIRAADPSAPKTSVPTEVAAAPDPSAPKAIRMEVKEKQRTIIETGPDGTGIFDGDKRVAVFVDESDGVKLDNPQIYLVCEELEVHFKEEVKKAEGAAPAAAPGDAIGGMNLPGGSNIEVAYARGRKVFIQKKNADGKVQIGQCREAIFDGDTGDLVMKVWPQIQQGEDLIIATEESTQIIIKQDGKLKFIGGTRTEMAKQ